MLGDLGGPVHTVLSMIAVLVLSGVLGAWLAASFASFACVVSERVPRGQSLGGRSHCACGRQLGVLENTPVIGWLACGGTARCCGQPIPVRYVAAEAVAGVAGAGAGVVIAWSVMSGTADVVAIAAAVMSVGVVLAGIVLATWAGPA